MAPPRSRKWTWTKHYQTDSDYQDWVRFVTGNGSRYTVYGKEKCPETGRLHLQGFSYFDNKQSLRQLKQIDAQVHLEISQGSIEQNITYCKKDGNYTEHGTPPMSRSSAAAAENRVQKRKERNALLLHTDLLDLVESGELPLTQVPLIEKAKHIIAMQLRPYQHGAPRGVWIYGQPGTGKTFSVTTRYPDAYMKNQNKWWDGYQGQETVLLDDLDTPILGHYLKRWMDAYACVGEIKGGHVNLRHKRFIVTANYSPDVLFAEDPIMAQAIKRRCQIIFMDDPVNREDLPEREIIDLTSE